MSNGIARYKNERYITEAVKANKQYFTVLYQRNSNKHSGSLDGR